MVKIGVLFSLLFFGQAALAEVVVAENTPTPHVELEAPEKKTNGEKKKYFLDDAEDSWLSYKTYLKGILGIADPFQAYMGSKVNKVGVNIDSFTGEDLDFDFKKSNRLEVFFPYIYYLHNDKTALEPGFRIKYYFPRTQKKLHLIVDSAENALFEESSDSSQTNQNQNEQAQDSLTSTSDNLFITLRATIFENSLFQFSTDTGVQLKELELDPFAGLRFKYYLPANQNNSNHFIQKLYWHNSQGITFDNQYRHDWLLDATKLTRFSSGLTWWHDDEYWSFSQRVTLYQTINTHRLFSYGVRGNWNTTQDTWVNEGYGLNYTWQEKVYKNWFYAILSPDAYWRHDLVTNDYHFEPSITFSIEVHFFQDSE